MRAYLYRWKLAAGRDGDFVEAWSANTAILRTLGSCGSRLHRGDDDWWYSYAQWPDAATRTRAFAAAPAVDGYVDAAAIMRECIVEALPEVALEPHADFLLVAS